MSSSRVLIDVPFKSMGSDGLYDDVERELSELAKYYHYDYVLASGETTGLGDEDVYDSVLNNFNPDSAHQKLASLMLSAIGEAARDVLGVTLNIRFKALVPPKTDGSGWSILGSVAAEAALALTGLTAPDPRALHDRIAVRLVEGGCDEDTFFDEYFNAGVIYFGASAGVDFDGFLKDVGVTVQRIDGHFDNIWHMDSAALN